MGAPERRNESAKSMVSLTQNSVAAGVEIGFNGYTKVTVEGVIEDQAASQLQEGKVDYIVHDTSIKSVAREQEQLEQLFENLKDEEENDRDS